MLAELVAKRMSLNATVSRQVLDTLDDVIDKALQAGYEVEIGSFGYLGLRDPVQTKPPRGEVTRGKRVAFREKDANRHRYK